MFPLSKYLLQICISHLFVVVQLSSAVSFGPMESRGQLTDPRIYEASGLAISRVHKNIAYTHNDKDGIHEVFAFDINSGSTVATLLINNATNTDWEDVAYGPCFDDCITSTCSAQTTPTRYCIYIADVGVHVAKGTENVIYAIREPLTLQDATVDLVGSLAFNWTEVNAETLMISPGGQLFIMSKVFGGRALFAEIPASGWNKDSATWLDLNNAAVFKITTNSNDPLGGDISPNGKNVIVVGEEGIYYLSVPDNDYIKAVKNNVPIQVNTYQRVNNSQGIAWSPDEKGFYVLAEGRNSTLYFYSFDEFGLIVG
ncbi:unnamed protein product [Lymnaea stagnalis]|uniref:Uncharacterized protein n=1 Tax=Lymnaea stagnalis TaxID=6523 RepID=A0AAV2HY56_LYMST